MYATLKQIEAWMDRKLTSSELTMLSIVQGMVEDQINSWVRVGWGQVEESTMLYSGGYDTVQIQPTTEITSVTIGGYNQVLGQEVYLQPLNDPVKTWLQFRCPTPNGIGNIAVVGKQTRGECPPDSIVGLVTYMVGIMFSDSFKGELEEETIEGYRRKFKKYGWSSDDLVRGILRDYRTIVV